MDSKTVAQMGRQWVDLTAVNWVGGKAVSMVFQLVFPLVDH